MVCLPLCMPIPVYLRIRQPHQLGSRIICRTAQPSAEQLAMVCHALCTPILVQLHPYQSDGKVHGYGTPNIVPASVQGTTGPVSTGD